MGSFSTKVALEVLCDSTNFRYCRLMDIIENHGCPGLQIGKGPNPLYDVPFFVLALIVTLFFVGFFAFLKPLPIKWKKQRATRGVLYWRVHLFLCGASVFFYALSVSVASSDGQAQRVLMVFRGICYLSTQMLLLVITAIDCHLIPDALLKSWYTDVIVFIVCGIIGLMWLSQLGGKATATGVVTLGILLPFMSTFIYWFAMIPVCVIRFKPDGTADHGWGQVALGIVYVTLIAGFAIGSQLIDLFTNGPICKATQGILSGASVGVLMFAFYRVFVQMFFTMLKTNEVEDGLPPKDKKKKLSDESSSEMYKPLHVEFSDYSYEYTYTSDEDDV